MADRQKVPSYFTPVGRAIYPKVLVPDFKYKPEGEFSSKLELSGADAGNLKAQIDEAHAQSVEEAKLRTKAKKVKKADPPYKESDENPGTFVFKFTMKHEGVDKKTGKKWTQRPVVVDSKNHIIDPNSGIKIGSGTLMSVNYQLAPYYINDTVGAGVKLRLKAVQIVKLEQYTADSPFSARDDGYDAAGEGDSDSEAPANESGEDAAAQDF